MRVLITGAQSDISQALKTHFQYKEHEVFMTTSQSAQPPEIFHFDLSRPELSPDLEKFIKQGVDALVLNAATPTYRIGSLEKIDFTELDQFIRANIQGNLFLLQKILPIMRVRNFGRIIFVSSQTAVFPVTGYSVYGASKSAMETVMKYVASEYGEHNITANSLLLGVIHTKRNDKYIRRSSIKERMLGSIALKRLGRPEDLFHVMDALLDKNSYIQGTVIDVAGGMSAPY
ncbi:MAG: SDR family NAD(P)-dependent oxidoreductase [Pseudobdellovibrionaceae bacterium]